MMRNHPVSNNRAMIDLRWCDPFPGGREALIDIMINQLGFKVVEIDLIHLVRSHLTRSNHYQLGARPCNAPAVVDCSSMVRWSFGCLGIALPRPSIDQREAGQEVFLDNVQSGDLIFTTGPQNYFTQDQSIGVGHVGILTEDETVLEASPRCPAFKEKPLDKFLSDYHEFRGVTRILPSVEDRLVLELGQEHDVLFCKDVLRFAQKRLPLQSPVSS
jgi:hypothetical protein